MEINRPNLTTDAIGFCLLPSELIQNILLYLALPEIMAMKLVNKSIAYVISDQNFLRECNLRSKSATWLFVYKKRWLRDAVLQGFSDQSTRWFKIAVADLLKPVISPGEDFYFLTACGNIFLFVCHTRREVIAVNLVSKTVKIIPASPLGARGTSSWRRSGMRLLSSGSDHFRFLFAELVEHRPVLFEYSSETDTWKSVEATETVENLTHVGRREVDDIFLNVRNGPHESVVIAAGSQSPVILRPRFDGVVGMGSRGSATDRMHVYGDGYMMIVRSKWVDLEKIRARVRMLGGVEIWGLSPNGRQWEYKSRVPIDIITQINKPYGVMMGCLKKAEGIIKIALVSNYECSWEIIWLSYDIGRDNWSWLPLPDCKMKGLNMAGIAFSRGLTFS